MDIIAYSVVQENVYQNDDDDDDNDEYKKGYE